MSFRRRVGFGAEADTVNGAKDALEKLQELLPLAIKAEEQVGTILRLEQQVSALLTKVAELEQQLSVTDEDTGARLQHRRSTEEAREMRGRAFSDDGTTVNLYPGMRRACSFKTVETIDAVQSNKEKETTVVMNYDDAVRSLEELNIPGSPKGGARALATGRVGYRLLTCNDEKCVRQIIDTGIINIPHLTKMLVKFKWLRTPKTVLLVKKPNDDECRQMMIELATKCSEQGLSMVVEDAVFKEDDKSFVAKLNDLGVNPTRGTEIKSLPIDFCICIGGDGTIIWTSDLFPMGCPPLLSIAMGSLGFLSTFPQHCGLGALDRLLKEDMSLTLRSRLEVLIYRGESTEVSERRTVLNEVVIDRGPNPSIVNLDLYVGKLPRPITHIQGDGIIISTPTGSTAYSLSAGGSMTHPSIPCMLLTPICPHSLSFRPIVVSDTQNLKIVVPHDARSAAFVAFDGKQRVRLEKGDHVVVRVSEFPVPCVCCEGESEDWFRAIKDSFNWNERIVQKPIQDKINAGPANL
uniref:NAD kinase n=1 Tax=Mucochytrium quahogii TaxID=96639 RepID=A0A7S2WNA3_9STRA|mmetsp:Transcript_13988/g.24772  ORF Transcript_13988/g.24772 Transcript_13988/m.24772 type:complete len:521 (-) Transcript_13988:392-1954(-)|eukprot:CAMPEP_0203762446 /NCGR_PEP_ID=MMETSP0098-20131031/15334_1 /ASSEMBLY_ACC=CAM_ASM_000208 /TAXON_ID=96639 /ORGANISM=" , Strain NY0313808BC1" /LENGTH=520 /DNA_ID=CAMNT_0050656861 /DNA_START=143 /DNA_END=1705 /DNA_ORIENTATION=-